MERWEIDGGIGQGKAQLSGHIKTYFKKDVERKCSVCGGVDWMGKEMPLVIDHINGNPCDNRIENLRLVCGNCDMQLPTYKSKNKSGGRAFRRQRYAEGKSY